MARKRRLRTNKSFHADESLACFLLKNTAAFADAEIIRTRDPALLEKCDVVVDVGGIYDHPTRRYDHHQREFNDTMTIGDKKYETKLSSAGLVFRHYGKEALINICQESDEQKINWLYKKMYEDFVEAFDGNDNGISRYPVEIKPKYRDSTGLAARVGRLLPWWNQELDEAGYMRRFLMAVNLVGAEFTERAEFLSKSFYPARELALKDLKNRFSYDESGKIIVFEQYIPWKEHLLELEEELAILNDQRPLYACYGDQNGSWRVQAVPLDHGSFENRLPLPEKWRGLRDEVLSTLTGIEGCIFTHSSGFIGGNKTKDGALKMAKLALKQDAKPRFLNEQ